MAAYDSSMLIFLLIIQISLSTYIQSVAANVESTTDKKHEKFVPLVAFECGFRNKFMGEKGTWISDPSNYATCLSGKLDILKYCQKAYPRLDITNIVEYSHEVEIPGWCREEGSPCKWSYTVRPYQCIVGEFHSEALQVPHGCRFGHINDRQSCSDYSHWKDAAYKQCKTKVVDGKRMAVRSFAVLEPCGLDLFTGVEFVCCANGDKISESKTKEIDDEEYDDDEEDDEDEDDEYTENENDGSLKESALKPIIQDPYFKISDPVNEHERFKEAQQRLEKRHRSKISKVMREWSDLEVRYKKMTKTDGKGAETFKQEMTSRFQKTITSLEEENKEQKKQLEDVHEERVQSNLNEKKRQATHDYRSALAVQVGAANKHNVLKALKAYIRAEEKDRTHMINRFRHLLRTDRDEAETYEPILLHQLRYIDLRINGTLAMLRDFPELERQVRPIALQFWADYRRENTPEVTEDEFTAIGGDEQNLRLVHYYKDSYDRLHSPNWTKKTTSSTTSTVKSTSLIDSELAGDDSDSDDDDDEYDNDERLEMRTVLPGKSKKIAVERIVQRKPNIKAHINQPQPSLRSSVKDKEEEGNSKEFLWNEKIPERKLRVEIEPAINEPVRVHEVLPKPSFAKHETLRHQKMAAEDVSSFSFISTNNLMLMFVSAGVAICVFAIILLVRRRPHQNGFIEVDVCTPEEKHVNGMQVNGYENPTYSFFDSKA